MDGWTDGGWMDGLDGWLDRLMPLLLLLSAAKPNEYIEEVVGGGGGGKVARSSVGAAESNSQKLCELSRVSE